MKLADFLACRQLHITCIRAGGFSNSEYRLFDKFGSHFLDLDLVSQVYLQVRVGAKQDTTEVVTSTVSDDGQRVALFGRKKLVFDYHKQDILHVSLYASRKLHSASLIGEGTLELCQLTKKADSDSCDEESQEYSEDPDYYCYREEETHVTLLRNDEPHGTVVLNCQIMLATDGSPQATPSAKRPSTDGFGFPQNTPTDQRRTSGHLTHPDENIDDRKLHVTCEFATDFSSTAYRFGDLSRRTFGDARKLVSQIYVRLDLGSVKKETRVVDSSEAPNGQLTATFQEKLVFDYRDQEKLKIFAYAKRGLNSDSLIGEGFLNFNPSDTQETSKGLIGEETVEHRITLLRGDHPNGVVVLNCQITSEISEALRIELPSYDYLTETANDLRTYADLRLDADT